MVDPGGGLGEDGRLGCGWADLAGGEDGAGREEVIEAWASGRGLEMNRWWGGRGSGSNAADLAAASRLSCCCSTRERR